MTSSRIYLDNAATSWPKPESVYQAVDRYQRELGAPAARRGATANSVSPGYCETAMVMAVEEDIRARILDSVPVGRLGKPSEIARTVRFLTAHGAGRSPSLRPPYQP